MLLQTPAERVKAKMKLQLSETGTGRLLILSASIPLFLMPPFQSKAIMLLLCFDHNNRLVLIT
jgi:hypothetical protein